MKYSKSKIERLIGQLTNLWKQEKASEELVAIGPAAVEHLIEALDSSIQIVMGRPFFRLKWRGVSDVAGMVEAALLRERIREILVKITGEDCGEDTNRWRDWWAGHKGEEPYLGIRSAEVKKKIRRFRLTVSESNGFRGW